MGAFVINFFIILGVIALLYLVLYLFTKYVTPIDQKVQGIVVFLLAIFLILWALTGHTLVFWR